MADLRPINTQGSQKQAWAVAGFQQQRDNSKSPQISPTPELLLVTEQLCNTSTSEVWRPPWARNEGFRLLLSLYYLLLSPGNQYLIPGWESKYFSNTLGRDIEHVVTADSTIFSSVTALRPGTLHLYELMALRIVGVVVFVNIISVRKTL